MNKKTDPKKIKEIKEIKGMKGFEDVVDLIDPDKYRRRLAEKKAFNDNYEMYTFLERENERLALVDRFFANQVKNQEAYPQVEGLITLQKERKELLKDELIEMLASIDSPLNDGLKHMFNKLFITGKRE